jgi:hypothetical protein
MKQAVSGTIVAHFLVLNNKTVAVVSPIWTLTYSH